MLKAVIFDFDGVIADSEPVHYEAFAKSAKQFDFHLSKDLYYKDYVGYSDRECYENLVKNFPAKLKDTNIEKMIELKMDFFEQIVRKKTSIIPGVKELLEIIKTNRIRTAICSGAILRDIELMLDGSGLSDYFEYIVSDDDVTKGKPDPQGYTLTLSKLNQNKNTPIEPSQCIVIEDSHWGLQAAQSAGMKTIAVTNTYHPEQLVIADKIVENLAHLSYDDLLKIM